MKRLTKIVTAALLLGGMGIGHATVRIANDEGGRIGTYIDKYKELRNSGELVIIDGPCFGACTIVLGAIRHDRICVPRTPNSAFEPLGILTRVVTV